MCYSTTGNTTAKITSQHGLVYRELFDKFGKEKTKQYLDANENAINTIKEIVEKENIYCDFCIEDSYVYTNEQLYIEDLKKEKEILSSLDFEAEFVTKSSLPFDILGGLRFKNQAKFNPRKYALSLCDIITKKGVQIFENTKVYDIQKEDNQYITYTKENKVKSKYVVLASHYPIINAPGFYFLKMYQEASYVIAIKTKKELFKGMYINVENPTYSFRTANDLILIGGSDHKTGTKEEISGSYTKLEEVARKLYPDMEIKYKWTTEDCMSLDKVPYIGEFSSLSPNMFVATGFNKWGMTSSHVAATIISNKILDKKTDYEDVFLSTRFHPIDNKKELGTLVGTVKDALIVEKLKKHKNPTCSHLGCELSWNGLDETWDCPCHGSRFSKEGKSLCSPSLKDIEIHYE